MYLCSYVKKKKILCQKQKILYQKQIINKYKQLKNYSYEEKFNFGKDIAHEHAYRRYNIRFHSM